MINIDQLFINNALGSSVQFEVRGKDALLDQEALCCHSEGESELTLSEAPNAPIFETQSVSVSPRL
jgi:hypothetical protein